MHRLQLLACIILWHRRRQAFCQLVGKHGGPLNTKVDFVAQHIGAQIGFGGDLIALNEVKAPVPL